jgi:hypothetical protein
LIWKNAVNVLFGDEWDNLLSLDKSLHWDWLFTPHNEHVIALTKLQTYWLWHLSHGNIILQQLVNYGVYGLLIFALFQFGRGLDPTLPKGVTSAFCLFLASPMLWENHAWAFQSQFHFSILFSVMATDFLFLRENRPLFIALGSLFLFLGIFSFSMGVPAAVLISASFIVYQARLWFHSGAKKKIGLRIAFVAIFILLGVGVWKSLSHPAPGALVPVSPFKKPFWDYFFNLISLGFGFQKKSLLLGVVCSVWILVPAFAGFRKRNRINEKQIVSLWAVVTLIGSVGGCLGAIAYGRASLPIWSSKASRYAEIAVLLVPLCAFLVALALAEFPKKQKMALVFLWLWCFCGFLKDWDFGVYRRSFEAKQAGVDCIRRYYFEKGDAACPTLYPVAIPDKLNTVQKEYPVLYQSLVGERSEKQRGGK